jgi:uncharacterized protein (TIGR02246 family)
MSDADRAAIVRASARLLEAVNRSDLHAVVSLWSEDGVMMPPGRPLVRGRLAIEDFFQRLFAEARFRFQFTASEIEIVGDLASERVIYVAEAWPAGASQPTHDRGKGIHLFRRLPAGVWVLAADLWNSDSQGVS